jgi:hypothetical protein
MLSNRISAFSLQASQTAANAVAGSVSYTDQVLPGATIDSSSSISRLKRSIGGFSKQGFPTCSLFIPSSFLNRVHAQLTKAENLLSVQFLKNFRISEHFTSHYSGRQEDVRDFIRFTPVWDSTECTILSKLVAALKQPASPNRINHQH